MSPERSVEREAHLRDPWQALHDNGFSWDDVNAVAAILGHGGFDVTRSGSDDEREAAYQSGLLDGEGRIREAFDLVPKALAALPDSGERPGLQSALNDISRLVPLLSQDPATFQATRARILAILDRLATPTRDAQPAPANGLTTRTMLLPFLRHRVTCALQAVRDNAPWDELCTCDLREKWLAIESAPDDVAGGGERPAIRKGFAGHGSHRPGMVCFECDREAEAAAPTTEGPRKDAAEERLREALWDERVTAGGLGATRSSAYELGWNAGFGDAFAALSSGSVDEERDSDG